MADNTDVVQRGWGLEALTSLCCRMAWPSKIKIQRSPGEKPWAGVFTGGSVCLSDSKRAFWFGAGKEGRVRGTGAMGLRGGERMAVGAMRRF